jgi:hypothetical protein
MKCFLALFTESSWQERMSTSYMIVFCRNIKKSNMLRLYDNNGDLKVKVKNEAKLIADF